MGGSPNPADGTASRLPVDDLDTDVDRLRAAGARFRNDIVTGVGGKQILLEDPDGNPIELFQATR
jgi:predicted enzyme related to lactoylglutathione lyase